MAELSFVAGTAGGTALMTTVLRSSTLAALFALLSTAALAQNPAASSAPDASAAETRAWLRIAPPRSDDNGRYGGRQRTVRPVLYRCRLTNLAHHGPICCRPEDEG